MTIVEELRHETYPLAHAVVALSPLDALVWKHAGVKSRFIPNPPTFSTFSDF